MQITEDVVLVQKSAEEEQEIDVKVHAKLVEVSDMVMHLINMGQGEVDERYPMILGSIKNMSTTLAVLTGLQQRLMAANSSLSIAKQQDGTYDISKVLLDLQNFMVKITEGAHGRGVMSVNYRENQIRGDVNMMQRIYGYVENILAGMAMMTERELSISALRYEKRDGEQIVFQEHNIYSNEKMCIWKKDLDEDTNQPAKKPEKRSQRRTKRKRESKSPTNPPQHSETEVSQGLFQSPPKPPDSQTREGQTTATRSSQRLAGLLASAQKKRQEEEEGV
jgi:hypothetical protein